MRTLFSVAFWTYFVVTCLVMFPAALALWIVSLPFDRQGRVNHWFTCHWAMLYVRAYPGWTLEVVGREKIDPGKAYILAANHCSFADIILVYALFRQFKWVSKHTVFRAPIVGWNMYLCRYVAHVRGDEESGKKVVATCKRWLERGMSVLLFPEGTRSKDGNVQPFKHGAFTLALETRLPVVPIAIHGTHAVMPKHGTRVATQARLKVEVLDPVPPDGFTDPFVYGEAVRRKIRAALGQAE